jgi:hypothetical protein
LPEYSALVPGLPVIFDTIFHLELEAHVPLNIAPNHTKNMAPNHEAHLLLGKLIERAGMRRGDFLARIAELGHFIGDDTFTNWGRPGRAFPRDWALIRAMLRILSDPRLDRRCSASEALRFCHLTDLPFSELHALAQLFPAEEFMQALLPYLPEHLAEHMVGAHSRMGGHRLAG